MKLVDSALVPAYLEPNSQSMQEKAVEVYRARTISQPEQHTNNANAKHKKPQTAPINLCTVNRTLQQTNTKTVKPVNYEFEVKERGCSGSLWSVSVS